MPSWLPQNLSRPCRSAVVGIALILPAAALAQADFVSYPYQPAGTGTITVRDQHGHLVGRILPQKRYWVGIERVPAYLQQALVAVEDARFYEHGGIDLRGIARALVKDAVKGRLAEGGSTITQQLIKNKYLTAEVSLDRKVKEARMAMDFEKKYTKQQILEMYFNEIYFGNGAWGIAQAARLYFDKRPEELTYLEGVLLAGVPKNPGRYNPFGKPVDVAARRDVVLGRLAALNIISAAQSQALKAQPIAAREPAQAPSYLARIRSQLIARYGEGIIEQGGLDVTAAVDLTLQAQAEQAVRDGVKRLGHDLQGALVCLDPTTGDVLAAVGGVGATQNAIDRAFASRRQPGSAIKPLIYAAALEQGQVASSLWDDAPVAYTWGGHDSWKPLNYGGEALGEITLRTALAHSSNVVTVKLLKTIGVPALVDFAARQGLALKPQSGLSLALGTDEVTLNDLVQAYTPLATGGTRAEARTILRVYDRNRQAWTENPPALAQAVTPAAAYITTQMLKDVLVYGTAHGLKHFSEAHPSAGKTGTTDDYQDAWFVGYTPRLLTGVWVGRDRPTPGGRGFTGGVVAAPIWERFMTRAVASRPAGDFIKPESVVTAIIDPKTGRLARQECPGTVTEFYQAGTEPTEPCPSHGGDPVAQPLPPMPPPVVDSGP